MQQPYAARTSEKATESLQFCAPRGPAEYRSAELPAVQAPASTPAQVALGHSGCQNASCATSRHLTPPSSGRPRASFAVSRSPLMSNVRCHYSPQ